MSWRSHWSTVDNLSVVTVPAASAPGVTDVGLGADVLVIADIGNLEAFVLEGTVDDWQRLAVLLSIRCAEYRRGIGATA